MKNMDRNQVSAWEETITLPTYPPPPADPNPMFLEKRINQAASGRVYPNPFTDHLTIDKKVDKPYKALFVENEYIQLMMLPEIGGRIHVGMDKTNNYDFFYRQHVVKPALIGLFGSWISGGVEWNWPMHHRPSTFMPVDYYIEERPDGSKTVWLSEHEPMGRMKGMVGLCLYPGKAFLEAKVRLYNRTPYPQTFLWWANVAVHVNKDYQYFFPPDVTYVTFHARADMTHFPVARGKFMGLDFGDGTEITWYKNTPAPTSFFVLETDYDFFGGYDHGLQAGVVNVANRFIAPGKKMFTWGDGEFGHAWERNLTDGDGPYIELMAGVYTNNQPDFSWLQPYETKTFSQFWFPIQKIGPAKNANNKAAVNLEVHDHKARVGVCVTEVTRGATLVLDARDGSVNRVMLEKIVDLVPGEPFIDEIELPKKVAETDLLLRVLGANGSEIIRYAPEVRVEKPLPPDYKPPVKPEKMKTADDLYLTGLHLEQYYHPTWSPEPYWEEALRRDPGDARCNNAMGLSYFRRGMFVQAKEHFDRAITTLTSRNPNPRDGEPYYNLGLVLKYEMRFDEAYATFYKAIWSYAWQAPGYYALAEIDCWRGNFKAALDHLERSLSTNTNNLKARNLKAAALRRTGQLEAGKSLARSTVAMDPLDYGSRNELVLIARAKGDNTGAEKLLLELSRMIGEDVQTFLDIAYDYANAGLWDEASDFLNHLVAHKGGGADVYPMVYYSLGYFALEKGEREKALEFYRKASTASPDYCFPVRLEEMVILQGAVAGDPRDTKASYYLGNLLFDKRRYEEAIQMWETSSELDPDFAIPGRNLGVAYYNIRHDPETARSCYLKAFATDPNDGRLLYELDQLMKRLGTPPAKRLARLEQHLDLVTQRDDLSIERVTLYNQLGQPQKALDILLSRRYSPWEGGEGTVSGQYVMAHFLMGLSGLDTGNSKDAIAHFVAAQIYPESLGEVKFWSMTEAFLHYYTGLAKETLGDTKGAKLSFKKAAEARPYPSPETYYNALALRKLGKETAAQRALGKLLKYAVKERKAEVGYGYFYTSLANYLLFEDDLPTLNRIHCAYLEGLAHLGLGQIAEARLAFEEVLKLDVNHLAAQMELKRLKPG